MIIDFISMDGYGIFVWSAFVFTFICCLFLYLKTKKELKKQEKMFLCKVRNLPAIKVKIVKKRKATKQILIGSPGFHH